MTFCVLHFIFRKKLKKKFLISIDKRILSRKSCHSQRQKSRQMIVCKRPYKPLQVSYVALEKTVVHAWKVLV